MTILVFCLFFASFSAFSQIAPPPAADPSFGTVLQGYSVTKGKDDGLNFYFICPKRPPIPCKGAVSITDVRIVGSPDFQIVANGCKGYSSAGAMPPGSHTTPCGVTVSLSPTAIGLERARLVFDLAGVQDPKYSIPLGGRGATLTVQDISMQQPAGQASPFDPQGRSIIETITPASAQPPPKAKLIKAAAQVTINLSGDDKITFPTSADLVLNLGSQLLGEKTLDLSQTQPGKNVITLPFDPPRDPHLLGGQSVVGSIDGKAGKPLAVNVEVICDTEEINGPIPFFPQVDPTWANELYGIPELSSAPGSTIKKFGCGLSDLAMLFKWYGINNTPEGSPLDQQAPYPPGLGGEPMNPGSLNYAFANYRTNLENAGSVALNGNNDLLWAGAAEIGQASHQGLVSYSGKHSLTGSEKAAISAIQNEICAGNAVILEANEASSTKSHHFMLATAIGIDKQENQSIRVNNPGTAQGKGQFYSSIKSFYPSIVGDVLYHNSLTDPSMFEIFAPESVQLVITDPLGRRSGYDPVTNTRYDEIPGADYELQSINTPQESGFSPETLVSERYFSSPIGIADGLYEVQVFAVKSGSYYLEYRSYGKDGHLNDSSYHTGVLSVDQSATFDILHSSTTVLPSNASLKLHVYSISKRYGFHRTNSKVEVVGRIQPFSTERIVPNPDLEIAIGGINGYNISIPFSEFNIWPPKGRKRGWRRGMERQQYIYRHRSSEVVLSNFGDITIKLSDIDLSALDQSQLNYFRIKIGSTIADTKVDLSCFWGTCRMKRPNHFWRFWPGFGHSRWGH